MEILRPAVRVVMEPALRLIPGTYRDCMIVGEERTLAADFGTSEVRILASRHLKTPSGWQRRRARWESLKASGPEPRPGARLRLGGARRKKKIDPE